MFDESDPRYIGPATDALEALAKKDVVFEINTGAIYRGSRLSPYPSAVLLGRIAELGGRVILASDAHCTDAVAYKFDEAAEYAAAAGDKKYRKISAEVCSRKVKLRGEYASRPSFRQRCCTGHVGGRAQAMMRERCGGETQK